MISESDLLARFDRVKRQRDGDWLVTCPAHEDHTPSLHITRSDERWLLHCLGNCATGDVMSAARLTWDDLSDGPRTNGNGRREVEAYPYVDESGELLFEVVRFAPKDFRQRRSDGTWSLNGVRRVVYRLPAVVEMARKGGTVYVVEGERDVHALECAGAVATTNPGGAGKWRDEYSDALAGANVIIVADRDEPGRKHARAVAESVSAVAKAVKVVEATEGKDAADHLRAGRDLGEFRPVTPSAPAGPAALWPDPLAREAFHGPAGEFVEFVAPHSEADLPALLLQYLVAAGNLFGPGPHVQVEGDEHPARLFVALVGVSAKGRKGTAWSRVRQVATKVDPDWADRIGGGLGSGEGPLWAVRDEIVKAVPVKEKGKATGRFAEEPTDPGVTDKRLLIVETELSRHFDVMNRQGNTLSETVRRLWDGGVIRSMTKNNPVKATDPHVSLIGHVTRDELRRKMTDTEAANGWGNRILWVAVKRRQKLPFGGDLPVADLMAMQQRLTETVREIRSWGPQPITFTRDAAGMWADAYDGELSLERSGMLGAITARAEAQALRLAVTYALLDRSARIEVAHLQAALAVWKYAAASATWAFADQLGDPLADTIRDALQRAATRGMSRSEIYALLGRNQPAERVDSALTTLVVRGLARFSNEQTGGRPAQRWFVTGGVS
jgi:5S rRNA maturation endonuclease (ribonuclease M5)